jgi:hypothetical protein
MTQSKTRLLLTFVLTCIVAFSTPVTAQNNTVADAAVADARAAIAVAEYARAINILTQAIPQQWNRAEDNFKEGIAKYPQDARFHNELAGVYLANNDLDQGRASLRNALAVDPQNKYATDLLATVDMSMGNVRSALEYWNRDGRPIVGDILNNGHQEFENWVTGKAVAFRTGETLKWGQWRTTEARLWESQMFSNVGVEVEPTQQPDRYNVVVRTVPKTNSAEQIVISLLETTFFEHPAARWSNIGNSGVSLSAGYRFATNRHRAEVGVRVPIPVPSLIFFEGKGTFRSERWDISRPAVDTGADTRFRFQSTGFRVDLKHIPHYRLELGAGFEYRNRTTGGSFVALTAGSNNSGKLLFQGTVLPADGRYRSRIHAETFHARRGLLGTLNYNGGTVEWNNRYLVDTTRGMNFELTVKGGKSNGSVPIDDYFVLGLDQNPANLLRGHNAVSSHGHYGHAPMGTSFALANATLDRRIRRLQLFNVLNVPFTDLKWQVFVDSAKTWDRAHVFNGGKLMVDVGGGFKIETPTRIFNITYGRSLSDGTGTLAAFLQKRW